MLEKNFPTYASAWFNGLYGKRQCFKKIIVIISFVNYFRYFLIAGLKNTTKLPQ
jgi:uncharacterized membrane protein (DUF485 family)